MIEDVLMSAKE